MIGLVYFTWLLCPNWYLLRRSEPCYDVGSPGCLRSLLHQTSETGGIKNMWGHAERPKSHIGLPR